jgi:hypothetical protein
VLTGVVLSLFIFLFYLAIDASVDAIRGPHYQFVCTQSHYVTDMVMMPLMNGNNVTMTPQWIDQEVCDAGYSVCVNSGKQVEEALCTGKTK